MKRFSWTLSLFICTFAVHAQTLPSCPPGTPVATDAALVCWANAKQNVDGTEIPATGKGSLAQTRIQRSFNGTNTVCAWNVTANELQSFDVTPDVTRMFFENLKPGRWCFRARHVALDVVDPSAWSDAVAKVTLPPTPPKTKPPVTSIY